jgi:hypothetical protein
VSWSADADLILDAFITELQTSSPRYQVPHWQTYRFGPQKWPYGKWLLDRFARFISEPVKLRLALAREEQRRAYAGEQAQGQQGQEVIHLNLKGSSPARSD